MGRNPPQKKDSNDYIGDDDQITPKWREAKEPDSIAELPESLKEIEKWREPLIQLVSSVYDKSAVKRGMLARQPKISYAEKHFKALSGGEFKYHVVTSYDDLLKECVGGR